jgi:hypothetical protein
MAVHKEKTQVDDVIGPQCQTRQTPTMSRSCCDPVTIFTLDFPGVGYTLLASFGWCLAHIFTI